MAPAIVVQCRCGQRLRVVEPKPNTRVRCPKCAAAVEMHRCEPQSGIPAGNTLNRDAVLDDRPRTNSAPRSAASSSGRWNLLLSSSWLLVGWAWCQSSGHLAFFPSAIETIGNTLPLLITSGLIAWNLWRSITVTLRSGRVLLVLPLTIMQCLLFCLLLYQIAVHRGAESYRLDGVPQGIDWLVFAAIHFVRAVDLIDLLHCYGLDLQEIHNGSLLTSVALMAYHLVVDLFLLRILLDIYARVKRALSIDRVTRLVVEWLGGFLFLALVVVWLVTAMTLQRWEWRDMVLWPLDNVLRVIDLVDAMQIFGIQLHGIPRGAWEGTLAFAVRLLAALTVGEVLSRVLRFIHLRWMHGFGMTPDELAEIAREADDPAVQVLAKERLADMLRIRQRPFTMLRASPFELLLSLGLAAPATLALMFVIGFGIPIDRR